VLVVSFACVRSEQPAVLGRRASGNIGFGYGRIAAVERAVNPHGMHDHVELAGHGNHRFAVAGAPATAKPQVLTLSSRLKRVSSADAAS
jgi:hypothetical protein